MFLGKKDHFHNSIFYTPTIYDFHSGSRINFCSSEFFFFYLNLKRVIVADKKKTKKQDQEDTSERSYP